MLSKIFSLLTVCVLLSISGCASNNQLHPNLSGPELATQVGSDTVALITNLGTLDKKHATFCSAVWIGNKTILTANHCVEGYAEMEHKARIFDALLSAGVPQSMAIMAAKSNLYDANPDELSDIGKSLYEIVRTVLPVNPDTVNVPFTVQSEVVDIEVAPKQFFETKVLVRNVKADLALLEVRGDYPQHNIASLAEKTPLVGEQVEVIGHVRHNYWFYRQGVVGAYRHSMAAVGMDAIDGPFLQVSAPISHGDSGGGVFDQKGFLVGIASFVEEETPGAYCIHLDTIRAFLAGQHIISLHIDTQAKDPTLE